MELSIRDWMLVIGVLLLLAVALDGYRRASRERRNQVRLSRNAKRAAKAREQEEDVDFPCELPNGGARVIGEEETDIDPLNPPEIASERVAYQQQRQEPTFGESQAAAEPVVEDEHFSAQREPEPEPKVVEDKAEEDYQVDPLFADPFKVGASAADDASQPVTAEQMSTAERPETVADSSVTEAEPKEAAESKSKAAPKEEVQPGLFDAPEKPPEQAPEEILVLNVLAQNEEGFSGEDLLHILLACDCRFGEMNIFHRYESANAKGQIQFSIVNLVEPGIFNLDDIKSFSTPGVSFFMRLPGPKEPIDAFDAMVETAQCLARNLNGLMKDENHSTVTEQTLEHGRQRIRDFLQRKLINA